MSKEESEQKNNSLTNELLETRTIVISGSVDSKLADKIIQQLLILEKKDPEKEIKILINSPGESYTVALPFMTWPNLSPARLPQLSWG